MIHTQGVEYVCKGIELIHVSKADIEHLLEGGQLMDTIEDKAIVITMEEENGNQSG